MNLAQKNAAIKEIDLGEWEFVHFVNHTQFADTNIFNADHEENCNIMFLIQHVDNREQTRLLCCQIKPWEVWGPKTSPKMFLFTGIASPIKKEGQTKEEDRLETRRYDIDKIQSIELMTKMYGSTREMLFVMQYTDSIYI